MTARPVSGRGTAALNADALLDTARGVAGRGESAALINNEDPPRVPLNGENGQAVTNEMKAAATKVSAEGDYICPLNKAKK